MYATKTGKAPHNEGKCHTEGCERAAEVNGLCTPCNASDYYWRRKNAAERRQRVKNLKLYQTRMESLHPPRLHSVKK